MNRRNVFPFALIALAVACLTFVSCDNKPGALSLDDLTGWIYVVPNPVGVGEEYTRYSFIYNNHETDTAHVDSCSVDSLVFTMDFAIAPKDTHPAVEEQGRRYSSAGTYVHTLTYYTTMGILTCPPCTVVVQ